MGIFSVAYVLTYSIYSKNSQELESPYNSKPKISELIAGYYRKYLASDETPKPIKKDLPTKKEKKEDLVNRLKYPNVPKLYDRVKWPNPVTISDEMQDSFNEVYLISLDENSKVFESVRVRGKLWIYDNKDISSTAFLSTREGFTNYYDTVLSTNDWTGEFNYNNFIIQGISADGVMGGFYGWLQRIGENQVITIIVYNEGYFANMLPTSPTSRSSVIECPCSLKLQVFVSDPINLDDLISQAIELDQKKSNN